MPTNSRRSRDILCPFYRSDTMVAINCEGFFDACTRVQLLFENKAANELHLRTYCCWNYQCCEVYQMVSAAKYEDDAAPPLNGSLRSFRRCESQSHNCKGSLMGHKLTYYYNKQKASDDMRLKPNHNLRMYAAEAGVFLWQIAEVYGVSYVTLNNWLRKELDTKGKDEFKGIVDKIANKEA